MTLREELERAHCCDELLKFASIVKVPRFDGTISGNLRTFAELWAVIECPAWLIWLMRHLPHRFEANWHDACAALYSVTDAAIRGGAFADDVNVRDCQREACRLIRQYVRLRA